MPYALEIPVQTSSRWSPQYSDQRAMHAILLSAWQHSDSSLSQRIHETPIKPFSQAFLLQDGKLRWRIGLLDDDLYEPLQCGLHSLTKVRIGRELAILDVAAADYHHESYGTLAQTSVEQRYALSFLTPTTFKQRYYHQPIPDPYLCFQSWWSRWNRFAPPELAINIALLDIVAAHLMIARYRIASRIWNDGQRRVVGGVGQMTFLARQPHKVEPHWWQAASALAAYARFCGTGHKTTQGLGQTQSTLK